MNIISRKDAHAQGLTHFYTGKKCARGHDQQRFVKSGACMGCVAHYARQYNKRYRQEAAGMVKTTVNVLPQHVETLKSFARLLELAATNGTPAPLVPPHDLVPMVNTMIEMSAPAAPVVSTAARVDPYDMWVRIHGREVADQMRDQAQ